MAATSTYLVIRPCQGNHILPCNLWQQLGGQALGVHLVTAQDILFVKSLLIDNFHHTIALDWTQIHQEILETPISS